MADRATEAFEHLQVAALEVIAACRALLDVAEEALRDPQGVAEVLATTARAAARATAAASAEHEARVGNAASERATGADPGVEHIRIG